MPRKPKEKRSKQKPVANPLFKFIAVVMLIILVAAGLVAFLTIAIPSPVELTSTSIIATNESRQFLVIQTATQSRIKLDQTMTAEANSD